MKKITIAIDGFSACGKSTLAKDLANKLGYIFIDSGAMYRGVALYCLKNQLIENNQPKKEHLVSKLPEIKLSFEKINDRTCLLLNGENVEDLIRTNDVASIVSLIASIGEVREKLVSEQQKMGLDGGIIMDGRDIGSVVFPNAELKLFVTASEDIRVQRRFEELKSKGLTTTLEEVKVNLAERDYLDTHREISPLIRVEDAILLDNSNLTKEEQLEIVLKLVQDLSTKK
jgi:cytidylate kinase